MPLMLSLSDFLGNKVSIEQVIILIGKTFIILNFPYFAVSQLDSYIDWGMKKVINLHNFFLNYVQ